MYSWKNVVALLYYYYYYNLLPALWAACSRRGGLNSECRFWSGPRRCVVDLSHRASHTRYLRRRAPTIVVEPNDNTNACARIAACFFLFSFESDRIKKINRKKKPTCARTSWLLRRQLHKSTREKDPLFTSISSIFRNAAAQVWRVLNTYICYVYTVDAAKKTHFGTTTMWAL